MKYNESGQTIIEAVVALAAVFVIVAAISVAILNALNNSQFVKSQNLANKYAQEGMEFVRRVQVEDIDAFANYSGTYAYDEDASTLTPGETETVNVGGTHIRNINFSNNESPCLDSENPDTSLSLKKVTVIVRWSSGNCSSENRFCHDTTVVSCIPYEVNEQVRP